MADDQTTGTGTGKKSGDDPFKQTKEQALTPEQKHQNYLDDVKRLHEESAVDALGNTPRAG